MMNAMEDDSENKEVMSEKFCHTCLCGARILHTIKDQAAVKFYLDCISEIPLSSLSNLYPEVCWECKAMLWKVISFKQKIKYSNKILQAYSNKNIGELISNDILRPSRLSVQVNQSLDISPEIEIEEGVGIVRSVFVKNESYEIVKDDTWDLEEENKSDVKCEEDKYSVDNYLAHNDENTTWSSEENNIEIKLENSISLNLEESLSETNEKSPRKRGRKKRGIKEKKRDRRKSLESGNDTKKNKSSKLKIKKVTVKLTQEEVMQESCQLQTDISQGAHTCVMCLMSFGDDNILREHLESKHNQKGDLICTVCNTFLSSDEALKEHYTKHFTRAPKSVPKGRVECTSCDKTFSHRAGLLNHTGVVHRQLDKFPCERCGKMFKWRNSLRKHAEQHEKPNKTADSKPVCVECDVSFASICSYKRHLRNSLKHVTQNQLKFVCDHCQQRYANKTKLRDHIEEKHLKKTFHCHICLKPSKNRVCLDQHIRNVHKGRPNTKICQFCGKGFPTKMQLESHLRAHTGERPFICEYCPTTFSQQSNLYKHYRQIHVNKWKAKVGKGDLIGDGVCTI